jgi:NAD(P)-dependent dehydrogenase (short-subunit alcohol dehydrogenase family)
LGLKGIEGKVAIVTGGAQGIGRAYALGFAAEGASVVVADINEDGAKRTAKEVEEAGGTAIGIRTDVSDESSTKEMAEIARSTYGGVDILINNAAIYFGLRPQSPLDIEVALWDKIMAVNVKGVWLCAKAVAPLMIERGGGSIVNQSSTGAHGVPMNAHYNASKAAVNGITKSLARDFGAFNIRVNAVAPGVTDTEATRGIMDDDGVKIALSRRALKRMGQPEEMVGAALYLASDMSTYVTGQIIFVDGGGLMMG